MFSYAISFNGKSRFVLEFPADASNARIEKTVLEILIQKWLDGKSPRKVIIVAAENCKYPLSDAYSHL